MNAFSQPYRYDALRWLMSGAVVLGIHVAVFAKVVTEDAIFGAEDPPAAMVVEFAEIPVAAANLPAMVTPGPEQVEAKATPEPAKEPEEEAEEKPAPETAKDMTPELQQAPNPEVALNERQPEKKIEQPPAPITSAPQALAEKVASVAAAPRQGAPSKSSATALPRWTSKISVLLERNKRYPEAARARKERGVVLVSFSIDREGRLLGGEIKRSSGSSILDREALGMLNRAQPFPPVPEGVSGSKISLTVPIRFDLH